MAEPAGWTISGSTAQHESGFELKFSGRPDSDNFEVKPKRVPKGLTPLQQTRLLREGVEAYRAASRQR